MLDCPVVLCIGVFPPFGRFLRTWHCGTSQEVRCSSLDIRGGSACHKGLAQTIVTFIFSAEMGLASTFIEMLFTSYFTTHVYKVEDKGSSICRIKLGWYENNVIQNLNDNKIYGKKDEDPTEEVKEAFDIEFVRMLNDNELLDKTNKFVTSGEVNAGVYYENPQTHKFKGIPAAKITVPEESYQSRGIKSDLNTATEKPGDWLDFHINPGMKTLPSFVQDTDNMLQKIEQIN